MNLQIRIKPFQWWHGGLRWLWTSTCSCDPTVYSTTWNSWTEAGAWATNHWSEFHMRGVA